MVFLSQLPMLSILACTFVVVASPIFYTQFFVPCMSCYDFEASIAHEVGHVLGFSHPDRQSTRNLRLDQPLNATTCRRPLRHVELAPPPPPPSAGANASTSGGARQTLMHSFTAHHVRTCLAPDDYAALHALYPTCDVGDLSLAQPNCIKPRQLVGYLRLVLAVAIPYVLASAALILSQALVKAHYHRRLQALQADVHRLQERVSAVTEHEKELESDLQRTRTGARAVREQYEHAQALLGAVDEERRSVAEDVVRTRAALAAERASHSATKASMADLLRGHADEHVEAAQLDEELEAAAEQDEAEPTPDAVLAGERGHGGLAPLQPPTPMRQDPPAAQPQQQQQRTGRRVPFFSASRRANSGSSRSILAATQAASREQQPPHTSAPQSSNRVPGPVRV